VTEPEGPAPRQEALQRIDKGYSRAFTTEPKIRRVFWHKQQTVKTRATVLQESFYPATDVHYNAVRQRMASLLGIVDDQSILAYLGRPETVTRNQVSQMVRYRSGAVVNKDHTFILKLRAKQGYIELFDLGHAYVKNNEWWIHWNHTEQTTLPISNQSEQPSFSGQGEVSDCAKVFKEDISLPKMEKTESSSEARAERLERIKRRESDSKGERNSATESIRRKTRTIAENPTKTWFTPTEKATIEERDHRRLALLDRNYLTFLENRSLRETRKTHACR